MTTKTKEKLQTISLGDAVSTIEKWDSLNSDFNAATKDIRLMTERENNELITSGSTESNLNMSPYAFKQLSNALAVPGHWSIDEKKCPSDLRQTIINHRLSDPNTKVANREWLVRTRNNKIRAMLSSYYTPFDHLEFIRTIDTALANMDLSKHAQIARMEVADKMRMWIVFPTVLPDADGNGTGTGYDGLGIGETYAAIYASNDEIGGGSIAVAPGTIRAACANGLIFWKEELRFTRVHTSIGSKLHEKVTSNITRSLEQAQSNLNDFLSLRTVPIKRPGTIINTYARKYRLPKEFKDNWLNWALKSGDALTAWDLTNIATELSQNMVGDMAETVDQMAGDMVLAYAVKS